MHRGTPVTEGLGGTPPTPDRGADPRNPARREVPKDAAPPAAPVYDEIHVEAHIILSEN